MDISTCLKSLLLTLRHHADSGSAQSAAQLRKQVEEVSALQCGPLLPAECVSALLQVAADANSSSGLSCSIVSLLAHLASDDHSWHIVCSSFDLSATLSAIIHRHRSTPQEPLVLQCLQLLQKLTYNSRIFPSSSCIPDLVDFLIANIQCESDGVTVACLGLMANLCRDNLAVQGHVRSLEKVKSFYRTLLNFLDHNSLTVVVFSLSILAGLTLREKVGEKLFGPTNIQQMFQLIFNILVNGDGTLTRKYSVDLLVDLLKNPKMAECLTKFQHFPVCVSQLSALLHSTDPQSAAKVLELLLSMSGVPSLRLLLCDLVLRPAGPRLRSGPRPEGGHEANCGLALVQWLSSPVEGAESCTLQVVQLLRTLLEEALGQESLSDWTLSFVEMLLPVLLELLRGCEPPPEGAQLRTLCCRITAVTGLLLLLCRHHAARSLVARQVSAQLCLHQVEALLSCCHSNSPITCPPLSSDSELSLQLGCEAVVRTLELMSRLRLQVEDMETSFYRMLQDHRMVTPLSLALTSHQTERVLSALTLLFEAAPLPQFPSVVLGESIAANNAFRQTEADLSVKHIAAQEVPPTSVLDSSGSSRGVSCLVEKIQEGLQLNDTHVSDIIDVYEHKLSALASKETRLQDLLEAKGLALSQADRLIAQYRLQRAQAEAEARQLASLLKEAERRREEQQKELSAQLQVVEDSKADTEELLQHNQRLQRYAEEHQALKGAYNKLLSRFNEVERLLKELQVSHSTLSKHSETLRRNHEALQLQHDRTAAALQQEEEETRTLQSDVQKKSGDIAGLRAALQAGEAKVKEKEQEKRELEDTVDVLRKELHKMEQARKEASIKASSVELLKTQLETKLKQKDEELNKHSAMIAMIHSLSSSKLKEGGNLSL